MQKMEERFLEKWTDDLEHPSKPNHSISHRFQDKCIFVFYAEIQDGCKKWQEKNFGKNWQMTAYNLRAKNLVQIALSCIVSKIHLLPRWPLKMARTQVLEKVADDCVYEG